jgi:hypothetical protein
VILASPWELIERKQPRPVGLQAKIISMQHICMSVSEGFKKSGLEKSEEFLVYIDRAIEAAQEAVQTLRGER